MVTAPIERLVLYGGLTTDHICLQRDGDGKPDQADGEEPNEARSARVAVGEQGGKVTAIAVQADEDERCQTISIHSFEPESSRAQHLPE